MFLSSFKILQNILINISFLESNYNFEFYRDVNKEPCHIIYQCVDVKATKEGASRKSPPTYLS
jgi:hypothetical protein